MNNNENIIKPFVFYPTDIKTNHMTKRFPLTYNPNNNTWVMEGNGIRLINIPNDEWVVTYLRDYVCSFYINSQAITTSVIIFENGKLNTNKRLALARVFAFLYRKINNILDYRSEANFNVKHYFDENGIMIQDVSPENIIIAHDKEYLEDEEYTYFKIYGADYYAKVNKYIRDFFIENCTNIRYSPDKGTRSSLKAEHKQISLNNIVYKIYNPGFESGKGVKLLNNSIQYHDKLNIYYMDFSITNLYYGNEASVDYKYAYIFMPKYNKYAIIDRFIYEKHTSEIMSYVWYINNDHVCTNTTKDHNWITLHRLIVKLLLEDNGIDFSIMNGITVHHIDENPLNNTIDNLFICSNDVHGYIHNKLVYDMSILVDSNITEIVNLRYIPDKYIKIQK